MWRVQSNSSRVPAAAKRGAGGAVKRTKLALPESLTQYSGAGSTRYERGNLSVSATPAKTLSGASAESATAELTQVLARLEEEKQ